MKREQPYGQPVLNYATSTRILFNIGGTQLGWFACVGGAAHGLSWLGPCFALCYLPIHLVWSPHPYREARFILMATLIGIGVESLTIMSGVLHYQGQVGWLLPMWMIALWLLFSSSVSCSFTWLQGRYPLAALIGGVAGPLSYLAGVRLGAATFGYPLWLTTITLVLIWAIVMPTLVWLAHKNLSNRV